MGFSSGVPIYFLLSSESVMLRVLMCLLETQVSPDLLKLKDIADHVSTIQKAFVFRSNVVLKTYIKQGKKTQKYVSL